MRWPRWRHSCLAVLSLAASVLAGSALPARATKSSPQLDALYAQVLKHPQDSQLNLRFARAAETAGVLRWALSAYERVTINDPANAEAQAGLQRIRRKLQPNISQVTVSLGSALETNPRYYIGPKRTEIEGLASAVLFDERAIGGTRWRTNGAVAGQLHSKSHDLDYGAVSLDTGPVLDVLPGWALVPALGGTASYYDHHFYYGEGTVSATFEGATQGAFRALQFRAGYRSYDKFFPTSNGVYTEARGRFAFPNALGAGSVFIMSPWARYSDIAGSVISPLAEIQPGAYVELGGKLEAYKGVTSWLVLGADLSLINRRYRTDIVPGTASKRHDTLLIPGASLLFPHILSYQTDFRIAYKYISDHSNDSTKKFNDHVVTATLVYRFDPTNGFWKQAETGR
jgi:hypothetical protein